MADYHFPLASVYKGWESYQRHLVTVVAPLSPEHLTLRAAPLLRSLSEQVIHLIAARARWLSLYLQEDAPELEPPHELGRMGHPPSTGCAASPIRS